VKLPPHVPATGFEVFLNGVAQRRDVDYRLEGRSLVFDRELAKEGKLGFWRWFIGAWGVGTYRQNDSIDIRYEVNGIPQVAEGLDIERAPSTG
jgi:hypothetical protein